VTDALPFPDEERLQMIRTLDVLLAVCEVALRAEERAARTMPRPIGIASEGVHLDWLRKAS
jgi:hypothetical protein